MTDTYMFNTRVSNGTSVHWVSDSKSLKLFSVFKPVILMTRGSVPNSSLEYVCYYRRVAGKPRLWNWRILQMRHAHVRTQLKAKKHLSLFIFFDFTWPIIENKYVIWYCDHLQRDYYIIKDNLATFDLPVESL